MGVRISYHNSRLTFLFTWLKGDSAADKAILSSMHGLHLLLQLGYIYVWQQGRIAAEGTFHYLRYNSSVFQDLWKHSENK